MICAYVHIESISPILCKQSVLKVQLRDQRIARFLRNSFTRFAHFTTRCLKATLGEMNQSGSRQLTSCKLVVSFVIVNLTPNLLLSAMLIKLDGDAKSPGCTLHNAIFTLLDSTGPGAVLFGACRNHLELLELHLVQADKLNSTIYGAWLSVWSDFSSVTTHQFLEDLVKILQVYSQRFISPLLENLSE